MTPVQLWVSRLNNLDEATGTLSNSAESNIDAYGIDYEGPLPSQRFNCETWNENSVQVPENACPVNDTQGIDIYGRTVQLVRNMLEIE
jgi:hypothetical protein